MFKYIYNLLKELYLKVSCMMCCKSECQVEVGNNNENNENNEKDE